MTPWKRLDLLIGAFADLRQRHDVRLLIVGEGPGRSRADEQIRQLGLGSCAETVGWVDDPLQFAARAWAFVLASDEEGFAQVLTEAMSAAVPLSPRTHRAAAPDSSPTTGGTACWFRGAAKRSSLRPWSRCCGPMFGRSTANWARNEPGSSRRPPAPALVGFLSGLSPCPPKNRQAAAAGACSEPGGRAEEIRKPLG